MPKKIIEKFYSFSNHKQVKLALFFSSWLILFFLGAKFQKGVVLKKTLYSEKRNHFEYKFINPLLECDSNLDFALPYMQNLKKKLNDFIAKKNNGAYISLYFRDLNNGGWLGINEDELFSPSSLIKVPLLIAYLKKAESNPDSLKKKILNTMTLDQSQNYKPEKQLQINVEYTVEELLEQMVIYSDNQIYELLFKNIDNKFLTDTYYDLGVDISRGFTDPFGNIISVKDYATFFRILFNASYLNREMSEKALALLSKTSFKNGLVAGVPSGTVVSHKFGERFYPERNEIQLHDCGIIYYSQTPYLLCVMTRGKSFPQLEEIIKETSRLVFQIINLSEK